MKKEYIYVLKCNDAVKVGYTTDLDKRIKSHQTSNPFIEFICSYEGSIKDESLIHKKLHNYIKDGCREWFNYYEDIFNDIDSYFKYKNYNLIENNNINYIKETSLDLNPFISGEKIDLTDRLEMNYILFEKLSSKARDLYLYIICHLPENKDCINLKIADVRSKTGISRNAIVTALQSLKNARFITPKSQSFYWVNPIYMFKVNN